MRILLVNQTFAPDKAATAQYFEDFARALLGRGHQVSILCSRQPYFEKQEAHSAYEISDGLEIFRVMSLRIPEQIKFARIFNAFFLNITLALRFLRLPDFDMVISGSSPPLLGWFVALANSIKRSRLILFCMDLNPDQVIAAGWIGGNSLIASFLKRAMRFAVSRAEKVWCLDREMKMRLEKYSSNPESIEEIDLWWDSQIEGKAAEGREFRAQHGISGQFVVMYSGNHSLCHPLDILLRAALVLQDNLDFLFVFMGGGPRFREVSEFKARHGLQNILQFPYQERAGLGAALRAADLLTVALGAEFIGIVHPCKFYSALGARRPVAAFSRQDNFLERFAAISQQISYFDQDDLSGFLDLLQMAHNTHSREQTFDQGFEMLRERFSPNRALQSLVQRLEA